MRIEVEVEVTLVGDECRRFLTQVVPDTAGEVEAQVRVTRSGDKPAGGIVMVSWRGVKLDGTPRQRLTGTSWLLTPTWLSALILDNPAVPLALKRSVQALFPRVK